jgi:molybdenum cofactor cytidylyltransferase
MSTFHFGAVILAAGASTRMGEPKQLLPWGGRSLIRHITETVLASPAWPVVVVLGAHLERIRPEIVRLPVIVVVNRDWPEGLASSIRTGIGVLESFSLSLDAALLALCDQPALSTGLIDRLAGVHLQSGRSMIATRSDFPQDSRAADHPGPPALFARCHFHELIELRSPGGARPLFARHPEALATIAAPEMAGDLDTPDDYRRMMSDLPSPPIQTDTPRHGSPLGSVGRAKEADP